MKNKAEPFGLFFLFLFLILTDYGLKTLANAINFGKTIVIIPNILSFEKVYNSGAAFGIFHGNTTFITVISLIISFGIIIYLILPKYKKNNIEYISFIFILAGALGNIYDRIFYSYVIDFIKLEFINFPVFNFADICINIGVIMLFANYLLRGKDDPK